MGGIITGALDFDYLFGSLVIMLMITFIAGVLVFVSLIKFDYITR